MASSHPPSPVVVCFGELLARLSTSESTALADAQQLRLHFGGAEANVAVQLAELGVGARFVGQVPLNPLADAALEQLQRRRVDASHVLRGGHRLGLYFLEPGVGPRPSAVTYDRRGSAMTEVEPGLFDWERIFMGAEWFHWSGITAALGQGPAGVCAEAITAARRFGLKVSCDINYRASLWTPQEAAAVLPSLIQGSDLCFCGVNEANLLLGKGESPGGAIAPPQAAQEVAAQWNLKEVAMLIRSGATADGGQLQGLLWDGGCAHVSAVHELSVVDRIGSGDCFAGAMLYAKMQGMLPGARVAFATAAAVWKHTIPGDWSRGRAAQLQALAEGKGGGIVQR